MILQYKNLYAQVIYSAITHCYHAEIAGPDYLIVFEAKTKQDLNLAMRQAVDQFLHQLKSET